MKWARVLLTAWLVGPGHAAIDINGEQVVEPALASTDEPAPIADIDTYHPDQHDCPLPCTDLSNTHSWITYHTVQRLKRCPEPLLIQLGAGVRQLVDDPQSTILIRACSLASGRSARIASASTSSNSSSVDNPKKSSDLVLSPLEEAPACLGNATEVTGIRNGTSSTPKVSYTGDDIVANPKQAAALLDGLRAFFATKDNCDESVLFAYHNQTVAGAYIGESLAKATITSAIDALGKFITGSRPAAAAARTVVQLCDKSRPAERTFGIAIEHGASGAQSLASVQRSVLAWTKGSCVDVKSSDTLAGARVFEVASADFEPGSVNGTTIGNRPRSLAYRLFQLPRYGKRSTGNTLRKRDPPKPGSDGICATHLIKDGDTCDKLATQFGIKTSDIEKWNKGKTWAWTECKDMLIGYNMCVSDGLAPMPPAQEGTECGPLVPNTERPSGSNISIADLNPCPLKACCSNWGYCGVFPAHCDIHAPPGGGPGTKEKGFTNTCVSNCGNEIKQVSGPPAAGFGRVGYYSAFNMNRKCLWLKAENANTDGTYTHIHWAFGDIDPNGWKPAIKDGKSQWEDFKKLTGVKKILSLGGWAYSTEPATYNIIRQAILQNRETFATNLAQFAKDEGLDGIDIDWEYPGAPDILVGGQPIGQKTDGVEYLKFLTVLKQKLGSEKSVSIAAPASFWYLKAFPIDRIAKVIDYIVYMTYDLHGQWDYGNPNSYDMCPSGKCIRSHINLTETRNSLSIITKAGVPNNKVFVGEASYGRSFHMAVDGCWGPMCEFTGSRTQSDAKPGRCTDTGGYLAHAEIMEIIQKGDGAKTFHDTASNSDIMLYQGDYISYMTPSTKDTRRADWEGLNFAGSIDWALDLQTFGRDDMEVEPERDENGTGEGCVYGADLTLDSGDLCDFSCNFGFCPESLCTCYEQGPLEPLPGQRDAGDIVAWDEFNVDLNRLCKFSCKYGYCPDKICFKRPVEPENDVETVDSPDYYDKEAVRRSNENNCAIYRYPKPGVDEAMQCYQPCKAIVEQAKAEGRTTNYGCVGFWPLNEPIPWQKVSGFGEVAGGKCSCDNMLLNEIADFVMEALPIIAQIGCYLLMSTLKSVVEIGLDFIPGAGRALSAGLDMALTAAETVNYVYNKDQDPGGAFEWWLSPCGGSDLVPEDIKKAFDILSQVSGGISSFKEPKNIKKGSGKKGDEGNPRSPTAPRKPKPNPNNPKNNNGVNKPNNQKCRIPPGKATERMGEAKNTLRMQDCQGQPGKEKTVVTELVITSLFYAAAATPTKVVATCDGGAWPQACWHYQSAIRVNPQWATLTCPPEAASTKHRENGVATRSWASQHKGAGWKDKSKRVWQGTCDRDEYPPAYLLSPNDPAMVNGGQNSRGQLIRYLPDKQNRPAGSMWKGACFMPVVKDLSDTEFRRRVNAAPANQKQIIQQGGGSKILFKTQAAVAVDARPQFTMVFDASTPPGGKDGLDQNPCWPNQAAQKDPGFALMTFDPFYGGKSPPYDYAAKYVKGSNGD
ncbi:carbohydrate-binding module family 24 protein [Naviculisporaceae sp. PSN 640]